MSVVTNTDYARLLIAEYGVLLSVEDLAKLFKYPNTEAVRRAHYLGRLPVTLRPFPSRRGQFVTAIEVADVLRQFEIDKPDRGEPT